MKKIGQITGFIVAAVITGYLFIHVSYTYRGYTRLMGFYGLESNTIDVVFIGTSVTFSSFMPMEAWNECGMAAYDYCTNVQFENSLRYSVREVLKTQSPKLIVIDVAPFIFDHYAGNEDWDEEQRELYIKYNIDSMKYSFDRLCLVQEINGDRKGDLLSLFYYYFDIIRYHTNAPSYKAYHNAYNDVERGYGYLEKNAGEVINLNSLVQDDGSEKSLEGCHEEYLRNLLAEVDHLDCDIVFYCAPILFNNENQFLRKNYIKKTVEESGYVFWDLSAEIDTIGLEYDMDFWSFNHFDSLGAEKVTDYLSKLIVDSYNIPDRRNDERYENWEEDYQGWVIIKNGYNEQDSK